MKSAKRSVMIFMVGVLALAAIAAGWFIFLAPGPGMEDGAGNAAESSQAQHPDHRLFHCPMHPTYTSDKPGDCPICGMKLVPVEPVEHESVVSGRTEHAAGHEGRSQEVPGAGVDGFAAVKISGEQRRLLQVRTERAAFRDMSRTIRTSGIILADERRTVVVTTKFGGWIEALHADFTGKFVKKGSPLFSIYSPELVAAESEYILSLRKADPSIAEASRRKLLYWDIPQAEIDALGRADAAPRTFTVTAPISGFIEEKKALKGMMISAGEEIFRITDLSLVWLVADVYENDLHLVKAGDKVKFTVASLPASEFRGRVSYVYPTLQETTRTGKVRIDVGNPDLALKPNMYATLEIMENLGERLAVPDDAVMDSGIRRIVFVDPGDGSIRPQEVLTGPSAGGYTAIESGLDDGQMVVRSANFLVDSESRLRAALGAMGAGHKHGQ